MSTLATVIAELRANIYGLRSARQLAADALAHGDVLEAERHTVRAYRYARTVRTIVRGRGRLGFQAYPIAREEMRHVH